MQRLIGLLLHILHQLDHHNWLDTSLFAWLVSLLLVFSPLPVQGVVPGGLLLSGCALAAVLLLLIGRWWGRRRYYVHFVPTPISVPADPPQPLWPADKVLLHVAGHLGVEGKEADFTGLVAYYRTFETREHAIMARQTPRRFLGGKVPQRLLGMWYTFITPHELQEVQEGDVYVDARPRPGLRLHIQRTNAKGKTRMETLYLIFATPEERARVAADLRLDMGGPAASPWRPPA